MQPSSAPERTGASEAPARASRREVALLAAALAVLAGVGVVFAVAMLPHPRPDPEAADDGPGDAALSYQAEQPVRAWHAGRWFPAHVHAASNGRYFITYDDFSISWHEWVTARRLAPR